MRYLAFALVLVLLVSAGCTSETEEQSTMEPNGTLASSPITTATPEPGVTVSVDTPDEVDAGSDFFARVNITEVRDFAVYQFDLTYDPAVLEVIGEQGSSEAVTDGYIDGSPINVDWAFVPPGTPGKIRVLGEIPGVTGITGSGCLTEIHFSVVGLPSSVSDLTFSNMLLIDNMAGEITPVTFEPASIQVAP